MRSAIAVAFFLLLFSLKGLSQNLVPNYSFETYTVCPGSFAQAPSEFKVPGWKGLGLGTPDHFHYCSKGEAGVPYNWAGVSEAYEGDGYAGLFLWLSNQNYREYLTCKLTEPLIKDSTYRIEFHYKLSSYSNYCIDRIGLHLSDSVMKVNHDKPIVLNPLFHIVQDSALTKTTGLWEHARFEYKAKGNELYLMIGNFSSNEETKHYKIRSRSVSEPMLAQAAYYYVDYVNVVPKYRMTPTLLASQQNNDFVPEKVSVNTNYVLKNIQFEFNSIKLLAKSFQELNSLADFLLTNPKLTVQVSGHTDDVGSEAYNIKLSRDRAKSVAEYLVLQGISADRINTFGYGKSRPLVGDTSEEARTLNRRVEVRFIQ